jgi:lipopolysaccharide transport system permease protein
VAVLARVGPQIANAPDEVRVLSARELGPVARVRELWIHRSLIVWFFRKFVERMYTNTALGWWWLPLRPLLAVVPRALIFGGVLNAPSNGTPYLMFFLVGLAGWELFYRTWYIGTRCFQMSARYLKRMNIPRLVPLVASPAMGIVEFVLYGVFALFVVAYYAIFEGTVPLALGLNTLLLPLALLTIIALGLSLSLWTSIPGARGRDTRWSVRSVLGVWMLLTPVIYPLSAVPHGVRTAAELNPMSAPMEMVREAVFGNGEVTATGLLATAGATALIGTLGLMFFSRSEKTALDYM